MSLWITMLAAGAITFAIRLSFIGAAGRIDAPAWFIRFLRFVPMAALSALVWPDLLVGDPGMVIMQPRLYAGLAAALVAWTTRNVMLTIATGMLALWLLQWLPGGA